MARRKTKKQKKQTDNKVNQNSINLEEVVLESISKDTSDKSKKIKTTIFSQSQVKLLYKDLLKTAVVTLVVFIVLLSIFMYMR